MHSKIQTLNSFTFRDKKTDRSGPLKRAPLARRDAAPRAEIVHLGRAVNSCHGHYDSPIVKTAAKRVCRGEADLLRHRPEALALARVVRRCRLRLSCPSVLSKFRKLSLRSELQNIRISTSEVHKQRDLVELWMINNTIEICSLIQPKTNPLR